MSFLLGIIQMKVCSDKETNLITAQKEISNLKEKGAKVILLPEFFNAPYGNQYVKSYAEDLSSDSPTLKMIKETSKREEIYLIAGSIPEKDGSKYYNTCLVADPKGNIVAKYRKMHLFDIDLPEFKYRESLTLSPGNKPAWFSTPWGKIGLGICFDLRFPKLTQFYQNLDCCLVCFPAAFTIPTGKLHWSLLNQSLAVNNQLFIASCSPARNIKESYHSYGHSMVSTPMGIIAMEMDENPDSQIVRINTQECKDAQTRIPISDSIKY